MLIQRSNTNARIPRTASNTNVAYDNELEIRLEVRNYAMHVVVVALAASV